MNGVTLGNRSILANPANKNMKDIINAKIKKRESFRPFAPSVLGEDVSKFLNAYSIKFIIHIVKLEKSGEPFSHPFVMLMILLDYKQ